MMPTAALPADLEAALSKIEKQLAAISTAVEQGDHAVLGSLGGDLRQILLDFSLLVDGRAEEFSSTQSQLRLKQIAQSLSSQREGLIRRSVGVERALQALMPASTDAATYVQPVAAPYGAGRKRFDT